MRRWLPYEVWDEINYGIPDKGSSSGILRTPVIRYLFSVGAVNSISVERRKLKILFFPATFLLLNLNFCARFHWFFSETPQLISEIERYQDGKQLLMPPPQRWFWRRKYSESRDLPARLFINFVSALANLVIQSSETPRAVTD